jgi:hypothetical protein
MDFAPPSRWSQGEPAFFPRRFPPLAKLEWLPIPFATLLAGDPAAFAAQARMHLAAAFALPQLPDRATMLPLKLSWTTLGKFGRDQLLFRHLPEPRLPAASAWAPPSVLSPRSRRPGARAAGADARGGWSRCPPLQCS